MLAIRLYYNYNSDKLMTVRLVDERTMQHVDYDTNSIKSIINYGKYNISNLEVDKYGRIRMINMNPKTNRMAYRETHIGEYKIKHYCIITGFQNGLISVIADTPSKGIVYGNNLTLDQVAELLDIEVKDVKFYNGIVKFINGRALIYIYDGQSKYITVEQQAKHQASNVFGENWDIGINKASNKNGFILDYAYNIKGESEAKLPEGVIHLTKFEGGVNRLLLPDSLVSVEKGCFRGLHDIYAIHFGKGLKTIPDMCFDSSSIETVQFSGYEEHIGESVFYNSKLRCPVGTNAITIGDRAFCKTKITSVRLLKAKEIGIESFAYNDKLIRVSLYDSLEIIGGGAFRGCTSITNVLIPPSVKEIRKLAFDGCKHLRTVKVSNKTRIHPTAFPKGTVISYYSIGDSEV